MVEEWTLRTERLHVRFALPVKEDIDFFYRLWTNGGVMKYVGFPKGLRIDRSQVEKQLQSYGGDEFDRVLLACLPNGEIIGECKLGRPDDEGLCVTDIKLSPEFWGKAYGRELKRSLVAYLFDNTNCEGVRATQNCENVASIKMQKAVGARRVGEDVTRFPEAMRDYTCDVPHYIYVVFREDWH